MAPCITDSNRGKLCLRSKIVGLGILSRTVIILSKCEPRAKYCLNTVHIVKYLYAALRILSKEVPLAYSKPDWSENLVHLPAEIIVCGNITDKMPTLYCL